MRLGLVVFVFAGAACGMPFAPSGRPPADPDSTAFALAWLGTYDGLADGTYRGAALSRQPVRLLIFVSQDPACNQTVAIVFEHWFDRCHLAFASAVEVAFEYRTDSTRHALRLARFSGDTVGSTILGSLEIYRLVAGEAGARLAHLEFTVSRR